MAATERATRLTISAADEIVGAAMLGKLDRCAAVAWRAVGVCERGGIVELGRQWRRLCDELDGPGYATAAHWLTGAVRLRTAALVALGGLAALSAERCRVCDRVDCQAGRVPRCHERPIPAGSTCELCAAGERAAADCAAHAVNWRARALAAEGRQCES